MNSCSITGIGTDITEVSRIEKAIERQGEQFIRRIFTANEIKYCSSMKYPAQHYAARFAAKEAFLKAIGTGWSKGACWTDIEIGRNEEGSPFLVISGKTLELAQKSGCSGFFLSLSHTDNYATAQVIAVK